MALTSDDDVHAVVSNWKARGKPNYIDEITMEISPEARLPGEKPEGEEEMDPLFDQVVEHFVQPAEARYLVFNAGSDRL